MNLKLLIYRARVRGVPVYCCFLLLLYILYKQIFHPKLKHADCVPQHLQQYVKFNEKFMWEPCELQSAEISKLASTIELLNYERTVFQTQKYGMVTSKTNMLVVQVHRDVERLQYLIVSLAQVRDVESILLVFSHSYYDDRINKLVSGITFCRFMQIFYPYSLQLYPNKFPGIDPDDCVSTAGRTKRFCSSRDGRLTEHKHHWWWKANFIFNNLDWSDTFKGTVVFLQEDDYVLPDLLYMLRYMTRSQAYLPGLHLLSFGRPRAKDLDFDVLSVSSWHPPFDKGLAFNKSLWHKISAVSSYYCLYDDLSWSYSLLNAFRKFNEGHVDMVATQMPRVVSTSTFPSGRAAMQQIALWLVGARMFPSNVKAVMLYSSTGRVNSGVKPPPRGNGGWGDLRDHLLCLDPLMSTTTSNTNDMSATTYSQTTTKAADYITVAQHKMNMSIADLRNMNFK
ncbi:alpha-1,6-mannosyl-glycoprotein 2-beta-N-acetylglucosaminyltransferase [Spodoptera frugiperda]|uniref:Alpha-1,6-mannosyl-glycoprotein 2-beta-N-acetylglucosaminyltransferase n=1 Tax=Spodoptera frugiperda TaxID=7108 RepID=A0A9R0EH68_SPOFR|nr:alpha-1,6-mannosyl-glycoprotein 2-beta-N-acetylglucosaminyltransferase [Spodoptera frugiperda]